MKPSKMYCKHCELNPCDRSNCSRKAIFIDGTTIKMVEPTNQRYVSIRKNELKRAYVEVPLTKKELLNNY